MLTPAGIAHVKRRIEAQRAALQERIASLERALAESDQNDATAQDRGDDAIRLEAQDEELDQRAFAWAELAQAESALARIEAGTYGISGVPFLLSVGRHREAVNGK